MDAPAESSTRVVELDGGPLDPLADRAAKATVLLFTRGDCPISNRYAPEVRRLHAEYGPRGVEFFLVYVDPDQSDDEVRAHVRDYGYACRVLLDRRHELVSLAGATITPEAALYVAGRRLYRGRIDDRFAALNVMRAQPTVRDLADALDAALAGREPLVAETLAIGCVIDDLR
ncbi:MAG: redoxin family protein [Planctomycetes bacterium]|nr:redoxin family protein [Planctomycetota bacterium]